MRDRIDALFAEAARRFPIDPPGRAGPLRRPTLREVARARGLLRATIMSKQYTRGQLSYLVGKYLEDPSRRAWVLSEMRHRERFRLLLLGAA